MAPWVVDLGVRLPSKFVFAYSFPLDPINSDLFEQIVVGCWDCFDGWLLVLSSRLTFSEISVITCLRLLVGFALRSSSEFRYYMVCVFWNDCS